MEGHGTELMPMAADYQKLAKAMTYLRNPECKLILTNTDPTFPTHGDVFPGGYSFVLACHSFSSLILQALVHCLFLSSMRLRENLL